MKINYNQMMLDEISHLQGKPKLLLHCCCAPCTSAVIERLAAFFDVTYFYYNPNIHPQAEFEKRKAEFKKLGVNVVDVGYNHDQFLQIAKNLEQEKEGGLRCRACIAKRMEQTFIYAKQHGFDYATTTLSISPHKDCDFINQTGEALAKKFNINYLHADFKKQNGYLRSTQICKQLGIYRQDFCGCEFSKQDE